MIVFALMTQKYTLAAFCCFFIYMFGKSLRSLPYLHLNLHLQPPNVPSTSYYAQVANATTRELRALLQDPPELGHFGAMGDRIARLSVLAEVVMKDSSLDQQPLTSLLRDYFPWWQPLPTTYKPWDLQPMESVGGTGIVICAGYSNLILAIHLIRSLRNVLNSTLPIQVAYAGDEDLSFHDRRVLTDLGPDIGTLNLLDYFDNGMSGLVGGSWAMKPFAMLASRFKETIVVDADAIFLRAPDQIFNEEPGLLETGTLFWHDRAFVEIDDRGRHAWVRSVMEGREPSPMLNQSLFWTEGVYQEMDSAVVCMDKGRPNVFMSLLFASWMNTREVRHQVTYNHVHGDKETFWLASELSSSNYSFMPAYASSIGTAKPLYPDNPRPAEPLNPFRSPLHHPSPEPPQPISHDPSDLKPRLGGTLEVKHHRIQSTRPSPPRPMQICSTQALQVDHLGRPFWFNGSLRKNKSNKDSVEIGTFTHVMFGNANMTEGRDAGWKVGPVSCLRKGRLMELEGDELKAIDGIIGEARRADEEVLGRSDIEEKAKQEAEEVKKFKLFRLFKLRKLAAEREKHKQSLSGWNASVAGDRIE